MEFIINLTIKSTLIILLSILLLRVFQQKTASLRHWVISLTMIGLLGLPLFIGVLPTMQVEIPFLAKQTSPSIGTMNVPTKEAKNIVSSNTTISTKIHQPIVPPNKVSPRQEQAVSSAIEANKSYVNLPSLATIVVGIWLLGACYFLLKFLLGLFGIWSITRNSRPYPIPSAVQETALRITQKRVQYLVNSTIHTPMTWGAFRPVVLLPIAANNWTIEELKAVVTHELSHIKRGDYWIHTLGLLAVCLYWYNPLIWWMKKQQLLEREKACDEAVLRSGIQRQNYAEQLLQITRGLSKSSPMISETALPMAKVSQVKKRIVAILSFEESKYRFSTLKQWQWGLFYGGLVPILAAFSPVGQRVIQEHFPLAKLETVTNYLDINTTPLNTSTAVDIFAQQEANIPSIYQVSNDQDQSFVTLDSPRNISEIVVPQSISSIPRTLATNALQSEIMITTPAPKTGLIGQWKDGSSEFKIWTYGTVKPIDTAPYFDIVSPDGMIFIEEYINGFFSGKVHQLTITKAIQDVIRKPKLGVEFDINTAPIIKKGEVLTIWNNNKSFLFFTKNMDKWVANKVQKIATTFEGKIQQNLIHETNAADEEWRTRVQMSKDFIGFLFLPKEYVVDQVNKKAIKDNLHLHHIPFKQISAPSKPTTSRILGRKELIGSKSGLSDISPRGKKFTTVIQGSHEAVVLKDFNFHLAANTFKSLEFDLHLYNVSDGNIQHAILVQPISIKVSKGTGWIRKDLSTYGIVSKGDILVVLVNTGFSGSKRGKTLYFSLADNYEKYQPILETEMTLDKKFWKRN